MLKYVRFILLFLFISTLVHAEYLRTIRIGSFPNEKTAEKAFLELNNFVAKHENIAILQQKWDFEFKMRPSGKYFITLAEPFRDRKVLQEVLDTLRLEYPDVYVTKLKKAPPAPVKKKQLKEVKKEDSTPLTIVEEKNTSIEEREERQKKKEKLTLEHIIQEKDVAVQNTTIKVSAPIVQSKEEKSYLWEILFTLTLSGLFVVLFFLLKTKKRNEHYQESELICEEKIEKLQTEMKDKEKLLSHVSHELRSPMTSILGLTHLVLESDLPKLQKDYVQKIEDSSKHLLNLINDILDISKIQAGELKIEKTEFNINDIINYVFNTISIQAKHNNISIDVSVERDVPSMVVGDSLRLGQILINLLGNSVKFTKDGEVSLHVKKLESFGENVTLEFIVSDTGIGMTSSQLKGLFKSFYQAEDSTSREYGGTGLGLAISKQLVELMNGEIRVESKKGVGTTFVFTIVFNLRDSQNKRQYRLPSASLLNKKVLLVDRYNKNSIPLTQTFGYFKYKTHNIESFKNSILVDYSTFDIIVVNLQNLTRFAIDKLKYLKEEYNVKIVVLSELHSSLNNTLLDELKVDAYLKPPITTQNILDLITELYVPKNEKGGHKKSNPKDILKKLGAKKILVAEDNELNHKVIAGLLAQTPMELTFVKNGQKVLDLLHDGINFDLILMDIHMPVLDGYKTTIEIRKDSKYNNIPILALTADLDDETVEKAIESGMQGYMTKPISYDTFYKKISETLQKKQINIDRKNLLTGKNEKSENDDSALAVADGISKCDNDVDFYKNILQDFKNMYKSSSEVFKKYCEAGDFKKARHLAMDVKDTALNIGAYKLGEVVANMEYEFEKASRSNWREHLQEYDSALQELLKEIDKYLKN